MSGANFAAHPFLGLQIDTGPTRQPDYLAYVMATNVKQDDIFEGPEFIPLLPGEEPPTPTPQFPKMNCSITKATSRDGTMCSDLDEVEEMVIADVMANAQTMPNPGNFFEIRRAMSAIAKETRRGMGNVVLMHPATAYEFRASVMMSPQYSVFSQNQTPQEDSHGWGLFYRDGGFGEIWTKRSVPPDVAIVLYKGNGSHDCGYLAIGHWSRPHFLRNTYGMVKPEAYARIVRF